MSPLLAKQMMREIVYGERLTSHMFRPERPPISTTREEAVAEIIKHHQAAWYEHRAVNSTKMGMHYELPAWLKATATRWYDELEGPYVLPPEFFLLVDGNPRNTSFFQQYYAQTRAVWQGVDERVRHCHQHQPMQVG
ncbi:MAG: hypothetical protein HC872_08770 [Gammaproteobacteria bacterium]|nr:hypothetical protein [Gammaproteobacteria bacterium]